MNVLFLLPRYSENIKDSTLEKELVKEFSNQGNKVIVATILEEGKTYFKELENIRLLKIRCGKYYSKGTTKLDKGMTILKIPFLFSLRIKEKINEKIDLIILSTPMFNNPFLIKKMKNHFQCEVLLIVWDIFPQNAIDLGIIKNKFLIKYFDSKYKKALKISDYITVMSEGNKKYIKKIFRIEDKKIILLKNWAYLKPKLEINKEEIRKKYEYSEKDFLAIFGGNMGKPQKLENILSLAEKCLELPEVKFIFVGNGSERERLKKVAMDKKLKNIRFIDQLPREDYEKFTSACNIGLVSLDERFTVPNFPSKTTDYFKLSLPILASLDKCSAADYGKFLEKEVRGGIFAEAGNVEDLYEKFLTLYNSKDLRKQLGNNGRGYYEEHLGVDKAYKVIINSIKKN